MRLERDPAVFRSLLSSRNASSGIFSFATAGDFLNWNPHIHALIASGTFQADGSLALLQCIYAFCNMGIDSGPSTRITELLVEASGGNRAALDEMLPLVYGELRRLANFYLSRERPGHTLQPTALVHEAYLRLVDQHHTDWKNRAQFFGLAAEMMRRILTNHARDRAAGKRGGKAERISLSTIHASMPPKDIDLLALDEALNQLSAMDARKSRIVELKFFSGLTLEEITEVLQISMSTVRREWTIARAWLLRWMQGKE